MDEKKENNGASEIATTEKAPNKKFQLNKNDVKQTLVKGIRALSFLLILSLILSGLSFVLEPKDNTKAAGMNNPNSRGFYSEPENSLDIVIIGNSDAYSAFAPMILWHKYGYTSYVSAEGSQNMLGAVGVLNEVLSCQKPKVIILEVDLVFPTGGRAERIDNTVKSGLCNTFSLFLYHNRWKTVDFSEAFSQPDYTGEFVGKGQYLSNETEPNVNGYKYLNKKATRIPVTSKPFLDEFVKICADAGVELLFVEAPSASSWNTSKHKVMKKYAKEKGIPFVDLDKKQESFNFNWNTDTRDGGNHLNNRGAKKVTKYIGKYLKKKYDITDKRENKDFDEWNKQYIDYKKALKKEKQKFQ